ncbi:ParB/RepB/Spo0J family partition protein [Echinimonas agarilytica]|uniref:Probable chromosome-partitioning protein ParB n=1 Tax=Echinimonas agarilytica TaxID=1215918 RepID=A0AA42B665_9GAMM|nr:ParB/RepB/Spo0J family partition protein [Echinimonas agarilytica]MCM2678116.1 ParB/RepB/Spo0J family partition protein [Echinimonas agarilytica]
MSVKKRGLGMGLEALLSNNQAARDKTTETPDESSNAIEASSNELKKLPIELLQPGKYQPRKDMSDEALDELANSIKAQGIIQPIVVRSVGPEQYEIIAGERRWRASQIAGLDVIPCLVKEVPDNAAVAIALIENIQREDLNAMEEAIALDRLMNEFELTHQQVAEAVGKSRTTVSNLLRLNSLYPPVKTMLEHGDLDMGHARALLALEDERQIDAANTVSAKSLSVRETEKLVKKLLEPVRKTAKKTIDPNIESLQNALSERLGASVSISCNPKGQGKLVIDYSNLDELDGILSRIN